MAEWGTRYYGAVIPITKETVVTAGRRYEAEFHSAIDIPDDIELALITQMQKLKDQVEGSETTYIYVKGTKILVQWYQRTASPITAWGVIGALLALAIVVWLISIVLDKISMIVGSPAGSFLLITIAVIALILVLFVIVLPTLGITKPVRIRTPWRGEG